MPGTMAPPELVPLDDEPRRALPRLALGIGAYFDTLDGRQKVRLMDLSQAGAQVILSSPEPIGEGVLRWLRFDTYAVAVWQDEQRLGLEFDRLLPVQFLVETRLRAPSVVREEMMHTEMARAWVAGNVSDD